jgi:hypothetical protein
MSELMGLNIDGLKAAQQEMMNTVAALEPNGQAQAAIRFATLGAHRDMTTIVHVRTGRLKNSLFPEIDGLTGQIITNVNYAPYEEARGGPHAFMQRTQDEAMPKLEEQTMKLFEQAVFNAWGGKG